MKYDTIAIRMQTDDGLPIDIPNIQELALLIATEVHNLMNENGIQAGLEVLYGGVNIDTWNKAMKEVEE
tara:strand:+ start:156 stop:362 length:207 start_codon:yes stop_codon:yes gene_type:complete